MQTIDLNCDMGESWYGHKVGNDLAILPYISSCNLACGFHGGDALSMTNTIMAALDHDVAIGAHPSFPDRKNFGRVKMNIPAEQMRALLRYQIAALQGMVESLGGKVRHLKPHGGLYHAASSDKALAQILAELTCDFGIPLLFGPPRGFLRQAADQLGLQFAAEGFADRAYESDLGLRSRRLAGAILHGQAAVDQAVSIAQKREVTDINGYTHKLEVETICIHGDHNGSEHLAREINRLINPKAIEFNT